MKRRSGFTLIELMVVLGIIAVISVVAVTSLFGARNTDSLTNTKNEIGTLLRSAQSRAISGTNGTAWGVHFDNAGATPFFALFSGSAYSTSTREGVYPLPSGVIFDPSFLASGSSVDITFAQVTGLPSTSTVIQLDLAPNGLQSSTTTAGITRTGSGKIFFDNFNRTSL